MFLIYYLQLINDDATVTKNQTKFYKANLTIISFLLYSYFSPSTSNIQIARRKPLYVQIFWKAIRYIQTSTFISQNVQETIKQNNNNKKFDLS